MNKLNQENNNWKEFIQEIVKSSQNLTLTTIFEEEDYSELRICDNSQLFTCDLILTSYFEELHDISIGYKLDNKELVMVRHFEGSVYTIETAKFLLDYLSPFLYEGWWIKKLIFIQWYKTEIKDKNKNQLVGPTSFHGFGLIIWVLTIFDTLAISKWVYIEPIK